MAMMKFGFIPAENIEPMKNFITAPAASSTATSIICATESPADLSSTIAVLSLPVSVLFILICPF